MPLKQKIVKNVSFVSIGELLSNLLSFFLIIFIARLLGTEGLGIYSFAFAFVGLYAVINDFGLSTFFVREVAKRKEDTQKYFASYATLRLILCLAAMLLPIISIFFLKRTLEVEIVVILASIAFFFQYYSYVPRNVFLAYQEMQYDAIVKVIERVIALALGLYVLWMGYGLKVFVFVLVISNFISFVISLALLKKMNVKFKFGLDYELCKLMLKTSWPFWLSMIFIQIYFQVDTVMLSFMKGYDATGLYNAAYKLIFVIDKIPFIVGLVLFPVMSELYAKMSSKLLKTTLEKGMYIMIIVSLPMIAGTLMLADRIISFIYKEGFNNSVIVLQILIWTTFFLFLSYLIGWFLNATHRQKIFTYATGMSLVINVALNLLLIPKFSYIGSSIATVITAIANFLILYYYSSKSGYHANILTMIVKPFISALAMAAFIFFFGAKINLLVLVPIAGLVYVLLLSLLGGITRDDLTGIF